MFARVSPLIAMDVRDYRAHDGGRSLRLYKKGATPHEVPAHPKAQEYLDAYVDAAGFGCALDSPLGRTMTENRACPYRLRDSARAAFLRAGGGTSKRPGSRGQP